MEAQKKSVCFVVTAELTAVTFYRGYFSYLADHGWDVSIIATSNGALEDFASQQGATAYNVAMRREPSPVSDFASLCRLILVLRALRPDLVVAATPKASLLGITAAYFLRVPSRIYQLWGLRLETTTGLRSLLFSAIEKLTNAAATQTVANSHSLANEAKRLGLARSKSIQVLGNGSSHGVNIEYFARDVHELRLDAETSNFLSRARTSGTLVLGYVGRVATDKGLETLLDAAEKCVSLGIDLCVLVVGPFESEPLRQSLTAKARAVGWLHLVGSVDDTRPYLTVFDVLCLPTLREGFPNVVLEAASMSVPAIVSNATGSVDSVVDGVTGRIFEVGSVDGLADCIVEANSDRPALATKGEAARARAVKDYEQSHVWGLQRQNLEREFQKNRRSARVRNS